MGEALDFIGKTGHESALAHLDTSHTNLKEADMEEAVFFYGKKLGKIYFSDNNRRF
jgi:hypothetical protein